MTDFQAVNISMASATTHKMGSDRTRCSLYPAQQVLEVPLVVDDSTDTLVKTSAAVALLKKVRP